LLFLLTCAKFPILSDLYNNRISIVLKGTYESNTPYTWNTNVYMDDSLAAPYSGGIVSPVLQSDVSAYIDIAEIRLGTGTGKTENVAPEKYWIYFTPKREVFCSNNNANGDANYKLLSCFNDNGDKNYSDFFNSGFTFPAYDVPVRTYQHMAIYFRKFITGPAVSYTDNAGNGAANLTTMFDNRYLYAINLMDSIVEYSAADTGQTVPLLFPLERTDLSLNIPDSRDPYVMEIRIFIKNLMMKHVIQHHLGDSSAGPITFIGPSDWVANHNSADLKLAYHMGGNIIFTARIYDPANVGSIKIVDNEAVPARKSYYAVMPSGSSLPTDLKYLPYAATSRSGTGGTVENLPPGNYDIYKTADSKRYDTTGLVAGQDGYPESTTFCTTVSVTAGSTTTTADIVGCVTP